MKGAILLFLIIIVACCFISGCTESAKLSDLNSAEIQSDSNPSSSGVTSTVVPTTVIPTPTVQVTAVPTETYSVSAKVVPEFSAGDIVVNGDEDGYTLITKVDTTIGKYSIRPLVYADGGFYLRKDGTFEEMGYGEEISGFDHSKFKYEYYNSVVPYSSVLPAGKIGYIRIYNSQDRLYGYLYYDTPTDMRFKFA